MPETKPDAPQVIPEELMLARLEQSEQMREFFIQMWLQNPALAAQGASACGNHWRPYRRPDGA